MPLARRRPTSPAAKGRADSGDLELDLVELFTDVADLAARPRRRRSRSSSTRCRTSRTDELAALCGACHEISQQGAPLIVVGAGLPHLPVALAASKSYAERLFRYVVVDRLPARDGRPRAAGCRPATEDVDFEPDALDELYALTDGYPYFVQAYGKVTWDAARRQPDPVADVREAAPEAEAELAVGFFGARYDRATPAERDYMRAMADLGRRQHDDGAGRRTADVAAHLGRKPQSLSPGARRADQEGPGLLQRARHASRSRCRTSASSCAPADAPPARTAGAV